MFLQIAGKDAIKIFSNSDELFEKTPDTFTKKDDHKRLFKTLHLIFSKTRVSRFLTQTEIADLEQNILNLSDIIFITFKTIPITIKMHDVLVHTVRFVRKFRTIGLFSEQSIESLHQGSP